MEWTNLIPWGISLAMFIISIVTLVRNSKKDLKNEYREDLQKMESIKESLIKVNMKLDQVCATTNETRSDIKAMNEYMTAVERRVSIIENTLDTVWVRIDELKEAVKK